MRQLRPGAGDSGHFFFYLVASLSLFSAAAAAAGSDVKDSFSQPPKDVAVVPTPQETYHAPGYGAIRRRNVVGNVHPRNLNDYELEDFYLVSTVGGMLSARDRKTGKERWNIHTEEGAVQTINHRANSTGDDHDHQTWIVQPSEDGELLFHTQDGLEKSSITVKDIIQSTPYTPHGTDMVYNGSKNTTTYAINARTGVVQRVFSTGGMSGVVNDKKCKTTTKLSDLDDECETNEISDRIIVLGRTGTVPHITFRKCSDTLQSTLSRSTIGRPERRCGPLNSMTGLPTTVTRT